MRCHLDCVKFVKKLTLNEVSADPGLCQGRGGAWDHRRCGTWLSGRKQRHTPSRQHLCQLHAPAIYMPLPFARPQTLQTLRRPPRQQLLQLHAPAICFSGGSRQVCLASNPPNASAGLQGNNSYSYYMPLPSVFQGVQDCRLPGLKPPKRFQPSRRPPRQQLLQLHAPAIYFSRGSRLPFKATALTATTCPCHLFFRGFKTAVCPASNPPNASNPPAGLQGNNSYSYYSYYMPLPSVFQGVQDCRLPGLKPPKRFQPSRRPPRQQLLQLHAPAIDFIIFQGVQDCSLPGLKPSKRFRRLPRQQLLQLHTCLCHLFFRGFKPALTPSKRFRRLPRQQLLQLHAPAICFSGGSRLPFARPLTPQTLPTLPQAWKATTLTAIQLYIHAPAICFSGRSRLPVICFSGGSRLPFARPQTPQTLPTLPQASKATTLTAITATTCPCHLFFRGFKTAVCPASNPPNASNPPASLQGNNSYSYMPLPSILRRPPRQQLLQLHAPAICFSGGARQVCLASNPPNASAGLQGNNCLTSYTLQTLPQAKATTLIHAPAICFSGGSRLLFARPQTPQTLPTLPQASKATTLTATTCPCHLKPPKRFQPSRRPPRQQLLQLLHAPAICFSGGSRLPFARPQTPQTLPTLPQASKATTLTATCPCHLFFKGFKTAV